MSDLGKIRAGSPRVYRDRVAGQRGAVIALAPVLSVDGLRRMVVHPDDFTEEQVAELSAALEAREAAQAKIDAVLAHVNALTWADPPTA